LSGLKEAVRGVASQIVVRTGVTALSRVLFPKQGAIVLYGHRISEDDEGFLQGLRPDWLTQHLEYLTRHFEVIPLAVLVRCLEERRPVPHRSVVLTFDDGFRDNVDPGLPILQRFRVPATVFLVTGAISSGELPWSQRLGFLFQHTVATELQHPLLGPSPAELSTPAARRAAYLAAKEPLKDMGRVQREAVLAELAAGLGVDAPRDRMLTWEQARAMQAAGIELGAHTYSHPLLARIPAGEARMEMERSREDLREHLGIERPSFCFPAGSVSRTLLDLVPRLGYCSAFQPNRTFRVNTVDNADAYSMSRVGMMNGPGVYLEAELDGPFQTLRALVR